LNAQNSDFNLELHAKKNVTASQIGLSDYPGATPVKQNDDDSNADFGFSFGKTHFRILVAKYTTTDTPDQVLAFYHKSLSHYGEVLECNNDKPVGNLTVTRSGLTCSGQEDGGQSASDNGSSDGHDLRAGSPHQFRIAAIDEFHPHSTRFELVFIELPKDNKTVEKK